MTLPERPAIIRLATAAETAQQPAPHMVPPPLLHNTGQKGEFVLPLNVPSATGGEADKYDDFTFDAVAWTMTAHEARPGHELQFDSMLEHGVSLARALYAFNSTNVEGWGLYSEWVMQPYEPVDGQLMTLQLRLLRDARAFLDPELQSGQGDAGAGVQGAGERRGAEPRVCARKRWSGSRSARRGRPTATSTATRSCCSCARIRRPRWGRSSDQKKFHDFLLAQGLLPPDLMRKAVMEEFVPRQKKSLALRPWARDPHPLRRAWSNPPTRPSPARWCAATGRAGACRSSRPRRRRRAAGR